MKIIHAVPSQKSKGPANPVFCFIKIRQAGMRAFRSRPSLCEGGHDRAGHKCAPGIEVLRAGLQPAGLSGKSFI